MTWPSAHLRRLARRGFSFVEVMFAVVILGVGFILVAAIFPVAISQNQATGEAASASAFARVSASVMQQLSGYNSPVATQAAPTALATYPPYVFPFDSTSLTGSPPAYTHGSFNAVAGNLISSDDPRYAVIPLYMRAYGSNVAQFYFFNVASRNQPVYTTADITPQTGTPIATLQPKLTQAAINAGNPSTIVFKKSPTPITWHGVTTTPTYAANAADAVGTGCYVLVANDNYVETSGQYLGKYNGKVYKVGNPRPDLDTAGTTITFELAPGNGFLGDPNASPVLTSLPTADVWIVGKGPTSSSAPAGAVSGAVQDVSFFTTFCPIN
jgi:prepilin-type N-terminal cleavage/methylation domain-containing protein